MGEYLETVPIITLRGKWLLRSGFFPKDQLDISVSPGSITLSVSQRSEDSRKQFEEQEEAKRKRIELRRQVPTENKIPIPLRQKV
jgi:hypothetical protein